MSVLQLYCKIIVMLSILVVNVFSLILADDGHYVQKRQVGVLARAGALPQGKRSVEVLARNGELPHIGGRRDGDQDEVQDLLMEELERAESLRKLQARALAERILEGGDPERFGGWKRSVAALARNGELPQKRLSLALARSGYLVRPPPETAQPTSDLLDPDDFLADGQPAVPEFLDERSFRTFLSTSKRSLVSDSGVNSYHKKNLASLARDGGFASLRHPSDKQRRMDDTYDLPEMHGDDKKNAGTSADDGRRRKRRQVPSDFAYDDAFPEFHDGGSPLEKRFLGRIPQLGRIHQKVQAPSSRRRPHLRPNWL